MEQEKQDLINENMMLKSRARYLDASLANNFTYVSKRDSNEFDVETQNTWDDELQDYISLTHDDLQGYEVLDAYESLDASIPYSLRQSNSTDSDVSRMTTSSPCSLDSSVSTLVGPDASISDHKKHEQNRSNYDHDNSNGPTNIGPTSIRSQQQLSNIEAVSVRPSLSSEVYSPVVMDAKKCNSENHVSMAIDATTISGHVWSVMDHMWNDGQSTSIIERAPMVNDTQMAGCGLSSTGHHLQEVDGPYRMIRNLRIEVDRKNAIILQLHQAFLQEHKEVIYIFYYKYTIDNILIYMWYMNIYTQEYQYRVY